MSFLISDHPDFGGLESICERLLVARKLELIESSELGDSLSESFKGFMAAYLV